MRTFADLLDEDLRSKGLMQDDILGALVASDEPPLTSSAVSMWRRRNRVPYLRLKRLLDFLGPESSLAKAYDSGEFTNREMPPAHPLPPPRTAGVAALERTEARRMLQQRELLEPGPQPVAPPEGRMAPSPTHREWQEQRDMYFMLRATDVATWVQELIGPLGFTVSADIPDRPRLPLMIDVFNQEGRRVAVFKVRDLTASRDVQGWAYAAIGQAWCDAHVKIDPTPTCPIAIVNDSGMDSTLGTIRRDPSVTLVGVDYPLRQAAKAEIILPHLALEYDSVRGVQPIDTEQVDTLLSALKPLAG